MKTKLVLSLVALVGMVVLVSAIQSYGAAAETGKVHTLKMWLGEPSTSLYFPLAEKFRDEVKAMSKGRLDIVLMPGSPLGYKGPEMLRVLKDC